MLSCGPKEKKNMCAKRQKAQVMYAHKDITKIAFPATSTRLSEGSLCANDGWKNNVVVWVSFH